MIETKLVRTKVIENVTCPQCQHVLKIRCDLLRGVSRCFYCGAEFEWEDKENVPASMSERPGASMVLPALTVNG